MISIHFMKRYPNNPSARGGKWRRLLRFWYLPPLAFYGMEVVHESGHVLAALLTGEAECRPYKSGAPPPPPRTV